LTGPITAKGYTVHETVTLSFTDNTHFTVSSDNIAGTGSGTTITGITGRTFIDDVTGLMFTLTPDALYAASDIITLTIVSSRTFTTSATPILDVPGIRLTVNNTTNTSAGDNTYVKTYDKAGSEPAIGSVYYATYYYSKTDFTPKIYTRFKDVVNDYGILSVGNPLTLAAYLLFLNGAPAVMIKQVLKDSGSETASSSTFITAIDELKNPVEKRKPDVILPVTTDETVLAYVKQHCEVMSSMRYRGERIAFIGFSNGTSPQSAQASAKTYMSNRICAVYPDGGIISLVDEFGNEQEYTVGGEYLAISLAGVNVSTVYDVAEPMTRKNVVGFKRLYRTLDEVTMDECAASGLTLIEDLDPNMRVRHCVTTNMTDAYTRELNITTIADYVQQSMRNTLDKFIGSKYLSNRNAEIRQATAATLKSLQELEIIVAYADIDVETSSTDPSMGLVSAKYRPMIGLNWIHTTFNLRSKL
ncbi:MAG: hypothetical protein WC934_11330, partial [Acidithiobacillus sp.]|uniref:hypothetical protein n=1 Tax=Acidithiobacillus sp. TaxID=1872118 RepID=UPI00355FD9D6